MKRRKNYKFEIQAESAGSFDPDSGTWATITNGTVYGEFWTVGGSERVESQKIEASFTHRIKIFEHTSLTTKHRMKYGTRIFNIVFIGNPDLRTREVILEVKENV